jgi:hypothetical protein
VKALPGEKAEEFAFVACLATAFPFSGIARGLEVILRRVSLYRGLNDLQTAARASALCIVVRHDDWDPGADPTPLTLCAT